MKTCGAIHVKVVIVMLHFCLQALWAHRSLVRLKSCNVKLYWWIG